MDNKFAKINRMLDTLDEDTATKCRKIYTDCKDIFDEAPGSGHNHQAWPGGYLGHVEETMNIACILYDSMSKYRSLDFALEDALLVLYLHDIEKPWKYAGEGGIKTKAERKAFREYLINTYGIELTPEQKNGLKYVEGEFEDYSNRRRVQGPLAAFCHMCDVASARIWFDFPED